MTRHISAHSLIKNKMKCHAVLTPYNYCEMLAQNDYFEVISNKYKQVIVMGLRLTFWEIFIGRMALYAMVSRKIRPTV